MKKAQDIQQGGPEYCYSNEWLKIWWPADEFILIRLCVEGKLEAFYQEAGEIFDEILVARGVIIPPGLLLDSLSLNRHLLKVPFQKEDMEIQLSFGVWGFYQAIIHGKIPPVPERLSTYHIDRTSQVWSTWDDWCREVVWYGNKKGAYLYGTHASTFELAAHY